jgi:hypothetical protein
VAVVAAVAAVAAVDARILRSVRLARILPAARRRVLLIRAVVAAAPVSVFTVYESMEALFNNGAEECYQKSDFCICVRRSCNNPGNTGMVRLHAVQQYAGY